MKPQSHGTKYCLPSIWPSSWYSIGHLVPVRQLAVSISLHEARVDVELLPAGVEVEEVRLAAALHQGEDVRVGVAELERDLGLRVRLREVDPEVLGLVAGPLEHEQLVRLVRRLAGAGASCADADEPRCRSQPGHQDGAEDGQRGDRRTAGAMHMPNLRPPCARLKLD